MSRNFNASILGIQNRSMQCFNFSTSLPVPPFCLSAYLVVWSYLMMDGSFIHSHSFSDLGEKSFSDHGQLRLKDLIETVLECVRADDTPVVGEQDNATAPAPILHV